MAKRTAELGRVVSIDEGKILDHLGELTAIAERYQRWE